MASTDAKKSEAKVGEAKESPIHRRITPPPTDVISSVRFHPSDPTRLLVTSWDRHLYLYDTAHSTQPATYPHRAPILDCAWADPSDANAAYTVGLDHDVRRLDLATSHQTVLSTHAQPASRIVYHPQTRILVSASWDRSLHIHHPQNTHYAVVRLPAKPFAIAISQTRLVVSMSTRVVHVYDVLALATLSAQATPDNPIELEPLQHRDSALKFMTRAVAAMPNDLGFACSSIEGRVAVEWFDPNPDVQAKKYAFKCHRVAGTDVGEDGAEVAVDVVYPVHALAFNPVSGTFASGGGDGTVSLWDAVAKRRIKQYAMYKASVGCLDFSADGKWLAVGVSPGFEDGEDGEDGEGLLRDGPVQLWIRNVAEKEPKEPKEKKEKRGT